VLVSIDADTEHACAMDVVVSIEALDKLVVVGHLKSGGTVQTNRVSVYVSPVTSIMLMHDRTGVGTHTTLQHNAKRCVND